MLLRNKIGALTHPAAFLSGIAIMVLLIVYGTRSDYDELNPFVGELLPAGHCLCHASAAIECSTCLDRVNSPTIGLDIDKSIGNWEYKYGHDDTNEGLSPDQCNTAFLGLFEDIDRAVKLRNANHIEEKELSSMKMYKGMVRAMIYKGELYVIEVVCKGEDHRKKVVAALSSIYRAVTTYSQRRDLPDIEFIFTIEDMADNPNNPIWVLTRRAHDQDVWLMPDFGFWSWNVDGIGPYSQVVSDIISQDVDTHWGKKQRKLIWRGKLSFAPKLRRALLQVAKNKAWSAVRALRWGDEESMRDDFVSSVDQCNYMFIAHTEGRSYSASLKYRQACRSVVIIHKMQWIQHHHYLLVSNGTQQNYVEVERDFSDLDNKMNDLLERPEEAKRIADNSVKTFRERYLTPAAEACYWRALIRGWAQVSFSPEPYEVIQGSKRLRGLRVESFIVLPNSEQLKFRARDCKLLNR